MTEGKTAVHPHPQPHPQSTPTDAHKNEKDDIVNYPEQKVAELKSAVKERFREAHESPVGKTFEQSLESGLHYAKQHRNLLLRILPLLCIFFILTSISIDLLENPGSIYNHYSFLPGAEKRRSTYEKLMETYENYKKYGGNKIHENINQMGTSWKATKDKISSIGKQGKEGMEYSKEQSTNKFNEAYEKSKDTLKNAAAKMGESVEDAKQGTGKVADDLQEQVQETTSSASAKWYDYMNYMNHQVDQATKKIGYVYEPMKVLGLCLFYLTFALYPGTSTSKIFNMAQLAGLGLLTSTYAYNIYKLSYNWPSMTLLTFLLILINILLIYLNWTQYSHSLKEVEKKTMKRKEEINKEIKKMK